MKFEKEYVWWALVFSIGIYGVLEPVAFINSFSFFSVFWNETLGWILLYAITFPILIYVYVSFNDDYWTRSVNVFVLILMFYLISSNFFDNSILKKDISETTFFTDLVIWFLSFVLISSYHLIMSERKHSLIQKNQFQYKIIDTENVNSSELERKLNNEGNNGWEVCNVSSKQGIILKRRRSTKVFFLHLNKKKKRDYNVNSRQ